MRGFSPFSPDFPARWSETSAIPCAFRASLPLKMTSCMLEPRSIFALCSPSTQLIASPMFDLPQPFGPTTAVIPSGKTTSVVSENDLNPEICIFSIFSIVMLAVARKLYNASTRALNGDRNTEGQISTPSPICCGTGLRSAVTGDEQVGDRRQGPPRAPVGEPPEAGDCPRRVLPRQGRRAIESAAVAEERRQLFALVRPGLAGHDPGRQRAPPLRSGREKVEHRESRLPLAEIARDRLPEDLALAREIEDVVD